MSLASDIELLGRVSLFTGLSADNLRLLAFSAQRRELEAGDTLFRMGDPARSGFIIGSGEIELATGFGKDREVLESCHRGHLIGGIALFVEGKRPADAAAGDACTLMEISRQLMNRMLTECPEVAEELYAKLAKRLAGTIDELQQVRQTLLSIGS